MLTARETKMRKRTGFRASGLVMTLAVGLAMAISASASETADDPAVMSDQGKSREPQTTGTLQSAHVSDACSTGSALVALHLAGGVAPIHSTYRRGVQFLIRHQHDDGSWLVKSRSHPFQTYFESGFPHGADQFISAAASGWAVAALTCPSP